MRIAYYLHLNLQPDSGVYKKICAQASQWRRCGVEVGLFLVTRCSSTALNLPLDVGWDFAEVFPYGSAGVLGSWRGRFTSLSAATERIAAWSPDVVYTRQDVYYKSSADLARRCRLVIEINTYDVGEFKMLNKLYYWYHKMTRGILLDRAAGLVFVTREISNHSDFVCFAPLRTVVPNGVDLGRYTLLPVASEVDPLRFIFIGADHCPWHGVDKILRVAENRPSWVFDIVGPNVSGPVPSNVRIHRNLPERVYMKLLGDAHVAIGTLGLHRKSMNEACPLKTREYLACGLPVIVGYEDTDFPAEVEFLCQIGNTEDNLERNLGKIESFARTWTNRRVQRECVQHLNITFKEAQRLDFFRDVCFQK
jgi:glycosyltransferase involved in cell wall biosynthesis